MSEKDDHLDEFYDDDSGQGIAFEQFSYIDWGFDTDHDQLNSDQNFLLSEKYTWQQRAKMVIKDLNI